MTWYKSLPMKHSGRSTATYPCQLPIELPSAAAPIKCLRALPCRNPENFSLPHQHDFFAQGQSPHATYRTCPWIANRTDVSIVISQEWRPSHYYTPVSQPAPGPIRMQDPFLGLCLLWGALVPSPSGNHALARISSTKTLLARLSTCAGNYQGLSVNLQGSITPSKASLCFHTLALHGRRLVRIMHRRPAKLRLHTDLVCHDLFADGTTPNHVRGSAFLSWICINGWVRQRTVRRNWEAKQ